MKLNEPIVSAGKQKSVNRLYGLFLERWDKRNR